MSEKQAQFRIIKNGPIEIKGNFTLNGKDGQVIDSKKAVYLCRCGGSGNKPFCDGSHEEKELND